MWIPTQGMGLDVCTTAARGIAAFSVGAATTFGGIFRRQNSPLTYKHTFHISSIDKRPHILAYTS